MRSPLLRFALAVSALLPAVSLHAASFYTAKLDDPKAVYLTPADFPVHADGKGDDTDALQQAIDKVADTTHQGIVFVPEGSYKLSKTVYVWEGIRLIGYGANRPKFVLADNTPGYQEANPYRPDAPGSGNYVLHFVSGKPRAGGTIRDANPGTFYSALSNIDIEIGEGNPAAIGVRFHIAQHCYISHVDFRTGSGKSGMEEGGNEIEDCHFYGGDYGIITGKTAPSWPFLIIDCSFEGQRKAGITSWEAGLTLVRDEFKKMPSALIVQPDRSDIIWIKDSRLDDISGPALVIGQENNAKSQTNLENIGCIQVPVLALLRDSGKQIAGSGNVYHVQAFCHGLITQDGSVPTMDTKIALLPGSPPPRPKPVAPGHIPPEVISPVIGRIYGRSNMRQPGDSDIPALPPCDTWANLHDLGAKGDGTTDDTKAIQAAIDSHKAIYIPSGRYIVTDTLTLKPDTVLIGLNPITTQFDLPDGTAGFQSDAAPKPLIVAPKGGTCIITGIGIDAGANPSAIGLKWMAGENSLVNDVRFLGGHGTFAADGSRVAVYNDNHTGDPDPKRRWDSQWYSLWITDGGGGTFKDIWTPDTFAQAGVYVSDTRTPGRMYAISIEHHVRNEVKIHNVSDWQFYAMQTEEERGESPKCLPYDIQDCSDLTFANVYLYRVTTDYPFPYGVKVSNSHNIVFHGLHAYSPGKTTYDNTVFDQTHNIEYRPREIALLTISGNAPAKRAITAGPELAAGAKVEKCIGGFENIDGASVDAKGDVYFVDARPQRIYRWSREQRELSLMRDNSIDPGVLAADKAGNLVILSRTGLVYQSRAGAKEDEISALPPSDSTPKQAAVALYAANCWRDDHDFLSYTMRKREFNYVAPDGSFFIPGDREFQTANSRPTPAPSPAASASPGQRPMPRGPRVRQDVVDLLRAYELVPAVPGKPLYLSDEFWQRTWEFKVAADGTLSDPKLFAEEGEAGVAVDKQGNVYIAAGNVFVYDPKGKKIDTIEVPERPASLVFGGRDGKTLFITARTSLYQVRTK